MGNELTSDKKGKDTGIVVVGTVKQNQEEQSHAQLEYCPTFQPLLRTSLNIPESRPLSNELVKPIDSQACLDLCIHLQNHLQQCSAAVKFDQVALTNRITEVDKVSCIVMRKLTERQRTFAKHAEHSKKVEEISASLTRLRVNLDQTLQLADELNMLLPENLRLDKFSL